MTSVRARGVVAVVGATATGKSALGMRLAESLGGEIIGADSRHIYRHMDIGTAKPTSSDRARVSHHLIDVADPDEDYSVALYLRQARRAIDEALARGGLPILVGGSGQYVWGLLEGWNVPDTPPDATLRAKLRERLRTHGVRSLAGELEALAPEAARRVDLSNPRRVIRALELAKRPDALRDAAPSQTPPPFETTIVGLRLDRAELYERIDMRTDGMFADGWVGEVERLLAMGYHPRLPSMSSLGYRDIVEMLRDGRALQETIEAVKTKTRRFARKQGAWFREGDSRIHWVRASSQGFDEALRLASKAGESALGAC